jgi:hypothetical protein
MESIPRLRSSQKLAGSSAVNSAAFVGLAGLGGRSVDVVVAVGDNTLAGGLFLRSRAGLAVRC